MSATYQSIVAWRSFRAVYWCLQSSVNNNNNFRILPLIPAITSAHLNAGAQKWMVWCQTDKHATQKLQTTFGPAGWLINSFNRTATAGEAIGDCWCNWNKKNHPTVEYTNNLWWMLGKERQHINDYLLFCWLCCGGGWTFANLAESTGTEELLLALDPYLQMNV